MAGIWHDYCSWLALFGHDVTVVAWFAVTSLAAMWPVAAVVTGICLLPMVHPRTRRVAVSIVKFTNRHSPKWSKPALVVCALIPGQADEAIVVAILLTPILTNAHTRYLLVRTIRYAWHTGR